MASEPLGPPPGDATREPELQYSVPCDDFRQEVGGKFLLIGVFESVQSESFPIVLPSVYVVNRWCNGVGEFREHTRFVSPDGDIVAQGRDLLFALSDEASGYTVVTRFANLTFAGRGVHWVEVLLNGAVRHRYPLLVEKGS